MTKKPRALVGARVSVVQGPEKVSHLAQLETTINWAKANGYNVIGQFEDLGVSAEKRPEDRPDLGKWLTGEGASQWDAIVWSKMDRAFRSTRHCVDFAQWAEAHCKVVVFAEDSLKLDYRPGAVKGIDAMMAELFVYLGSFFAQLELNRFKSRAADSHRVLRGLDRWASGVPPLGFKVVDHPSGKGKGLERDTEGYGLLHGMAEKLLGGWSFIRIAAWLNESGALTNMDRARVASGKAPKARPWSVNSVIDALTSPRTQGLKMTGRGKHTMTVLDAEGEPIRLAEPTFDADTWKKLQEAAQQRKIGQRTPSKTANPVLGVAVCGCTGCPACGVTEGVCGSSLAQQITRKKLKTTGEMKEWRSYRCGRTPLNCNGVSARGEDVDFQIAHEFTYHRGAESATRRVFVPGEDHSAELDQVNSTIDRLRLESDAGLLTTPEDESRWLDRMKAQVAKRDQLAAMPSRAAGWVTAETDQTKAEAWRAADEAGRRQLYLDAGMRYVLTRKGERDWFDRSGNTRM
ncbi:recombinase family protein [Mycobacterium hodleri]|uniref:recombinase family protein n=1 Tax=Mycolicibacterium hodleri TaxID=49897 RepID=UPI0021F3B553|nr:recombinase family protein [Mycolicibacterium hodleri]MCV7132436.1 recombinase family protein [Mycolicibacterium hodleri]